MKVFLILKIAFHMVDETHGEAAHAAFSTGFEVLAYGQYGPSVGNAGEAVQLRRSPVDSLFTGSFIWKTAVGGVGWDIRARA